jgi:hypothetical protein
MALDAMMKMMTMMVQMSLTMLTLDDTVGAELTVLMV